MACSTRPALVRGHAPSSVALPGEACFQWHGSCLYLSQFISQHGRKDDIVEPDALSNTCPRYLRPSLWHTRPPSTLGRHSDHL